MFVNTQPQYKNNGSAYNYNPTKAKSLLKSAGFTMGSDGYYQPNYGCSAGRQGPAVHHVLRPGLGIPSGRRPKSSSNLR